MRIHVPRKKNIPSASPQKENGPPLCVAQIILNCLKTPATRFNQSELIYFYSSQSAAKPTYLDMVCMRFPALGPRLAAVARLFGFCLVNGFFRRCDWLCHLTLVTAVNYHNVYHCCEGFNFVYFATGEIDN